MSPESGEPHREGRRRTRSPFAWIVVIALAGVAFYLSERAPKEQHVRFVVGANAPRVTRLTCDYDGPEGTARAAEFTYAPGEAPRVIAHDPELVPGEYTLHVRVFSKEAQNTVERRVTLASGTVSIDLVDYVPGASTERGATPVSATPQSPSPSPTPSPL